MKLAVNIFLFLTPFFMYSNASFSITNYQIKKLCKNVKKKSTCIKSLMEKRSNLQKGNFIEIPVIPFKK